MEPLWLARLHACLPPLKTPAIWREVCSESKPVLLATLLAERRSPTLILVPSLERAEQWLAILLRLGLSESQVLRAPAGLTPILEPTGVEPEVLHERIRALRALAMGEPVCVIAPITSALQTTLTPERFRAECLRLRTAETPEPPDALSQIEPADLLKQLVEDGYEYQEPVRLPGHFARRGGIVDVFPMGAELPLRIEFWGDEITSLRLYEPSSQRSIKSVGWAIVPPAREVPMGTPEVAERVRADWDAQIARQPAEIQPALRERLEDDLRPLQQGAPFDRLELYLPWLTDERACIVDYLPSKGLLVLDEPLLMRSAHERLIESLQQSLDSRAERGDIIPLEASRYVEPIERVFAPPQRLVLEAMETPDLPGEVYEIGTRSLETARGRLPDLWNSVQRWYEGGYQVVIATDRPNQVARVLKEVGLGYVLGSGQSAGGSRKGSGENALTHPSPPSPEASGEGGSQTPLSHSVGEGLGVRADTPLSHSVGAGLGVRADTPLSHSVGAGLGVRADTPLSHSVGEGQGVRADEEIHGRDARATESEEQGVRANNPILLLRGNLGGGFVWDAHKFALLTDAELFERSRLRLPPRRFNEGVPISSIMDLKPGDYVVHIYHGVGIFRGLTTLEREGAVREYLLIEYAHPDKIFVPTDQLDRIQKYLGPDDKPPEIRRLNKTVAQARKKAKEVAEELIRLYALREKATRPPTGPDTPWQAEMESAFPYIETPGQLKAIEEVKRDLESPHPMDRLLVGDVGFGKTEVAIRGAFKVIMADRQVALMCPTTVLAYQHWQTFKERFEPFGVRVELLSRLIPLGEQKRILHGLKTGAVDMVIGTHRLLSDDIQFKNLGLVIIDEEQRFGVMQKEKFKKLRGTVDVLSMSATPIPRTLYMALTEIRDMSIISDPPPGRLPIRTSVMPYTDWTVREAILRELQRDGQVFYVVPRVQGIEHLAERIKKLVPHARIAVAHGQMPPSQMEAIVLDFYQRAYDILVCTTIIENGLDMPNVNTLIVENAERFGLGQLYQLRGRVGRSDRQAYAYFLFKAGQLGEKAEERLEALKEFSHLGSGFALAMRDLEIRGAGNLLGTEQHGAMRAVGFELYQAMLRDAIRHLRKGETTWSLESPIEIELPPANLPVNAYIPNDYISDTAQRLGYYKRIAGSRTREELKSLVRELRDRYGELPVPVKHLLRTMEIRILAYQAGAESLHYEGGVLLIKFRQDRLLKARWQLGLMEQFKGIRTQPDEIRFKTSKHLLESALEVLKALQAMQSAESQPAPVS